MKNEEWCSGETGMHKLDKVKFRTFLKLSILILVSFCFVCLFVCFCFLAWVSCWGQHNIVFYGLSTNPDQVIKITVMLIKALLQGFWINICLWTIKGQREFKDRCPGTKSTPPSIYFFVFWNWPRARHEGLAAASLGPCASILNYQWLYRLQMFKIQVNQFHFLIFVSFTFTQISCIHLLNSQCCCQSIAKVIKIESKIVLTSSKSELSISLSLTCQDIKNPSLLVNTQINQNAQGVQIWFSLQKSNLTAAVTITIWLNWEKLTGCSKNHCKNQFYDSCWICNSNACFKKNIPLYVMWSSKISRKLEILI